MINSFEFAKFLQGELDELDVSTTLRFKVRTPDLPFLDTIAVKVEKPEEIGHFLPVMVVQTPEGEYSPTPEIGLWEGALEVDFIFPLSDMNTVELYYDALAKKLSGKIKNVGEVTGDCVLAIGQRTFGAMQNLDISQYSSINEEIKKVFGQETRISREWCTMTFQVYANGASDMGGKEENGNGILMGNQVKCVLTLGNQSEELIRYNDASSAREAMLYNTQGISESETKGVETSTAYGSTITAYVRNNEFWNNILTLYKNNGIGGASFSYKEVLALLDGTEITLKEYAKANIQISFSYGYGEPLSCSLSITEKETAVTL